MFSGVCGELLLRPFALEYQRGENRLKSLLVEFLRLAVSIRYSQLTLSGLHAFHNVPSVETKHLMLLFK
jgi:hypothetical protein